MFIIRSTFVRTLIGLGLGTFAIGCGGPEEGGVVQEEALGTSEAAACTDVGAANYQGILGSNPGDRVSSTSGVPYNNTLCPTYYLVEAAQTGNKHVVVSAAWADASVRDSQVLCTNARLTVSAWGYNGGWAPLGTKTVAGTWDSFFGCSFMWTPSVSLVELNPSGYSRIRVAAKAYINSIYGPMYHPVTGTVAIPSEPAPVPR